MLLLKDSPAAREGNLAELQKLLDPLRLLFEGQMTRNISSDHSVAHGRRVSERPLVRDDDDLVAVVDEVREFRSDRVVDLSEGR